MRKRLRLPPKQMPKANDRLSRNPNLATIGLEDRPTLISQTVHQVLNQPSSVYFRENQQSSQPTEFFILDKRTLGGLVNVSP